MCELCKVEALYGIVETRPDHQITVCKSCLSILNLISPLKRCGMQNGFPRFVVIPTSDLKKRITQTHQKIGVSAVGLFLLTTTPYGNTVHVDDDICSDDSNKSVQSEEDEESDHSDDQSEHSYSSWQLNNE